MERFVNKKGLELILSTNVGGYGYNTKTGISDGNFIITLKDGRSYLVKRGYRIDWDDEDYILIQERSFSTKDVIEERKRSKPDRSIFDTLADIAVGMLSEYAQQETSHQVKIYWSDISNIQLCNH